MWTLSKDLSLSIDSSNSRILSKKQNSIWNISNVTLILIAKLMDLATIKSLSDSMNPMSKIGIRIRSIVEQLSMHHHSATWNYEARMIKLFGRGIDGIKRWMSSSNIHINWSSAEEIFLKIWDISTEQLNSISKSYKPNSS